MTDTAIDVAERLLRVTASDALISKLESREFLLMNDDERCPPEWREAFHFLLALRLVEVEGDWLDRTRENEQYVLLTELGIDAVNMGLRPYLKRRQEREQMRFQADRATARGYKINLWGIIFLVFGLLASGVNLYIFYRQVFEPPLKAIPAQIDDGVDNPQISTKPVQKKDGAPYDAIGARPYLTDGKDTIDYVSVGL